MTLMLVAVMMLAMMLVVFPPLVVLVSPPMAAPGEASLLMPRLWLMFWFSFIVRWFAGVAGWLRVFGMLRMLRMFRFRMLPRLARIRWLPWVIRVWLGLASWFVAGCLGLRGFGSRISGSRACGIP